MAVCDDQVLVVHGLLNAGDGGGVGHFPQPMDHAIFVCDFDVGRAGLGEQGVNFSGRVAVQHEDLAEMGFGRPQKIEPVGLGLAQSLLMAEDDFAS